ncbi:MAG: hypothetical protein K8S56_09050, partial [Candidatus Cloacimonetes bacterium]|nr:hypothetical protein [Candidatus Cloacimonadota bacterium]
MIRYIPSFILNQFENSNFSGEFNGYVLFFDIADFTKIGGEFRKHGKAGAEELARFMEEVFGFPIGEIEKNGGFISFFAGDAFGALFPEGKPENIIAMVSCILIHFRENPEYTCRFGKFVVKVRMTICYGKINWRIFRNDYQCEYVFFGEVLREMGEMSEYKEDVIFSYSAANQIGLDCFNKLEVGYNLAEVESAETAELFFNYPFQESTKSKFIHPKFASETPSNEIRDAAYCFIDFTGVDEVNYEEVVTSLHRLLNQYGGHFNRFDATDKGLVGLMLFGIPITEGETLDRICRFTSDTIVEIPELSIGIASGNVFAGFAGSKEVNEYTSLGSVVNLSIRLMSYAKKGEVLAD